MGFFTKDIKTLDDLFVHGLQDIYYAEHQITKALPKMAAQATDPQLRQGFETHLRENEGQIRRLEQGRVPFDEAIAAADFPPLPEERVAEGASVGEKIAKSGKWLHRRKIEKPSARNATARRLRYELRMNN